MQEFGESCEILISTPLKISRLVEQFPIDDLQTMVIDEADKMFEMGFYEQIEQLDENCPTKRKFMFSATMQPLPEYMLTKLMKNSA